MTIHVEPVVRVLAFCKVCACIQICSEQKLYVKYADAVGLV